MVTMRQLCVVAGCMLLMQGNVNGKEQLKIAGVSHITITVANLSSSIQFYTKLLGGMLSDEMSMLQPTASREYVQMFTKGKLVNGDDGCSGAVGSNGNCESMSSSWQVSWAFVIFDNMMVQLVHYTSLKDPAPTNDSAENNTAPPPPPMPHMDMMGTKLAFWVMDTVNMTEYANTLEDQSHRQGFNKVRFMRPLLLADTAENRQANDGVHNLRDQKLKGLSIGYASGPDGESLKFIQLVNSSREQFNRHYCQSRLVTSALLDKSNVDKCGVYKIGHSSQLYGVNHISITTMDINRTLSYYVDQLGGHYVDDIEPSNLQSFGDIAGQYLLTIDKNAAGPSLQKLLMKFKKPPTYMSYNSMASRATTDKPTPHSTSTESAEDQMQPGVYKKAFMNSQFKNRGKRSEDTSAESTGVPILDAIPMEKMKVQEVMPSIGLNLRYVLLGNIKLEIAYLTGLPLGMDAMMNNLPAMMASMGPLSNSFMKPGNMEIALMFHTNESLNMLANQTGALNQASETIQLQTIEKGPLADIQYVVTQGPAKDDVRLVHFGGQSRRNLHTSLREYGAVNRLFVDTNPWNFYGYETSCAALL